SCFAVTTFLLLFCFFFSPKKLLRLKNRIFQPRRHFFARQRAAYLAHLHPTARPAPGYWPGPEFILVAPFPSGVPACHADLPDRREQQLAPRLYNRQAYQL
ncbi:unnamed protein product, partial [Amoebophrya sp. A120]